MKLAELLHLFSILSKFL